MKKKLMAIVIAASLIGGIGTTTYASAETINKTVVVDNTSNETTNDGSNVNTSDNGTSSNENDGGAVKVNIKSMEFFKFINIKFNNIVVSIQDFFNSVIGNNSSGNQDSSTDNSKEEDSTIENDGQAQDNEQNQNNEQINNNEVTNDSNEITNPAEDSTNNSQENVEKPSTDVDNSDTTIKDEESNNSGNNVNNEDNENSNNSNNAVKPETQVTPQNKPSTNTGTSTPSTPNTSVQNNNFMASVEQMIFNKVNEERAKAGVATLSYNSTMEKYARIKSQDMGDNNYFSHNDLQGNLITANMKADGVSYKAWGENIAYIGGVSDTNALATQFMTNWMNSQGHKDNILSTNFTSIGVGVYKVGNKVYATQEFYK